ncbi:MAG: DUF2142 domain-containing protein [Microbacteriaceae bacterium]
MTRSTRRGDREDAAAPDSAAPADSRAPTATRASRRRFRAIWLAPVLAILAISAWAFASPPGSSPDDDYHLVSIWCANEASTDLCEPGSEPGTREVASSLLDVACFARDGEKSGACQLGTFDGPPELEQSARGNFVGAYPPVYYSVMSVFTSDDVPTAALTMRILNGVLLTALTTALFLLLPVRRRATLVWAWIISVVPLGLFLIASNNPSSWAVIGVGTAWMAALGWYETTGRRRIGLGVIASIAVVVAAGARADAAIYAVLGIAAAMFLSFRRGRAGVGAGSSSPARDSGAGLRSFALRSILPIALIVVAALFVLFSRQASSGVNGFTTISLPDLSTLASTQGLATGADSEPDRFALLLQNLLGVPSLWAGPFGYWSLGWFDTSMPPIVAFGGLAVFIAVCFTGIRDLGWRKALVTVGALAALIVIPVVTLTRGGHPVGIEVQPRYILPLMIMFAGFTLLATGDRVIRFSLAQRILLVGTLIGVQAIALFFTLRRYVTGDDVNSPNLDAGLEWWWSVPFGPTVVLAIGSLAWAGLVILLVREVTPRPDAVADREAGVAPVRSAR